MKKLSLLLLLLLVTVGASAQVSNNYWNIRLQIDALRLPPPPIDYNPEYLDINGDGKPDVIKSITRDSIPILWLDDDGNMKEGDLEGDLINDCLLIDTNKDGIYERVIKYADLNDDGKADLQLWAEYPDGDPSYTGTPHYMVLFDSDQDGIFNDINWNLFHIGSWDRYGISAYHTDYSGEGIFTKTHTSTDKIADLRFFWENPFYLFDPDNDGLTEMSIRIVDSQGAFSEFPSGTCTEAYFSVDLDNNNNPRINDFDYDMSLKFLGQGFNYTNQTYPLKNMRGLPEADTFFIDPRLRQLTEFVFPSRDSVFNDIFHVARWDSIYFAFDEDNDCGKWERADFYAPKDPFLINQPNAIDNAGTDAAGDRTEFDLDNSGNGQLYIGRFDGRIHLYGANWGVWRLDQNATYYHGFNRSWLNINPEKFATVKYTDSDNNGFIDRIEYDIDGDFSFETVISLIELGISDVCDTINISSYTYDNYKALFDGVATNLWNNAITAQMVAEKYGIQLNWYNRFRTPLTLWENYDFGYWLQYYIYNDLLYKFSRDNDSDMINRLTVAYYSSDWGSLL